jgi:hypothetical protein
MDESGELMALFEEASNTAEAIDALSEIGVTHDQIEVMTGVPYPEGALERHVEWSRLPYVVLAGALGGLIVGLFLSVITPHLYRLDVGGHPTVSFPPAAVITFVFTMMATIISTFLGVLWEMGFPEFGSKKYNKMVTDGYLAIFVTYPPSLETSVRNLLEENGGTHIQLPEWQQL